MLWLAVLWFLGCGLHGECLGCHWGVVGCVERMEEAGGCGLRCSGHLAAISYILCTLAFRFVHLSDDRCLMILLNYTNTSTAVLLLGILNHFRHLPTDVPMLRNHAKYSLECYCPAWLFSPTRPSFNKLWTSPFVTSRIASNNVTREK